MATAAQIEANRRNSKSSTGPKTAEGKQKASANATKFGLFTVQNYVQPEDREEYDNMCAGIYSSLNPVGHLEDMIAADIIRCAWRLRRCAAAEQDLISRTRAVEEHYADRENRPAGKPHDPLCYDMTLSFQTAIDRARSQTLTARRRAWADLEKLQNERFVRSELAGAGLQNPDFDLSQFGIATVAQVMAAKGRVEDTCRKSGTAQASDNIIMGIVRDDSMMANTLREFKQNKAKPPLPADMAEGNADAVIAATNEEAAATNRTQTDPEPAQAAPEDTPRNAPCPCNSGLKYKRCCGENAPPQLNHTGANHGAVAPAGFPDQKQTRGQAA